ncbi:hypothetical protein [Streptomyces sp. NBC_00158]|uniref:hypothetical protein n=1 Tax=Streptomyces sp. NBC_00158 TaxID=2903627 RepID=UPI003253E706
MSQSRGATGPTESSHQEWSRLRTVVGTAVSATAKHSFHRSQRPRGTDWVAISRAVPCSRSAENSGAPSRTPNSTGRKTSVLPKDSRSRVARSRAAWSTSRGEAAGQPVACRASSIAPRW